jgi:hypothetical protein
MTGLNADSEASTKSAPTFRSSFSEYVDIDVDIKPSELEEAGWVYVGKGDGFTASSKTVLEVVRAWHDREHPTAWPWCDVEPCRDLR